jgi:hypothetical protein
MKPLLETATLRVGATYKVGGRPNDISYRPGS